MKRSETLGLFCLIVVYVLWGSTFLSIRMAVETIPPMIAAFGRHGFGGLTLALGLFIFGKWVAPNRQESLNALAVGALTAGISNGALMWAEVKVPSSYAAIAFTTMPLFMLILNWVTFERVTPSKFDFFALPFGLLGSSLVLGTGTTLSGDRLGIFEIVLLVICPSVWAFGSLLGRKIEMPKNILVSSSLQMIGGAILLIILSSLHGDLKTFSFAAVTPRSFWGVLYLAIGGSLIGYTAFATAIRNLDPRIVATYAFMSPLVAVSLGGFFGEEVGRPSIILGIMISVGSVVLTFVGARYRVRALLAPPKS